jgi:hypothetical protein
MARATSEPVPLARLRFGQYRVKFRRRTIRSVDDNPVAAADARTVAGLVADQRIARAVEGVSGLQNMR